MALGTRGDTSGTAGSDLAPSARCRGRPQAADLAHFKLQMVSLKSSHFSPPRTRGRWKPP